MTTAMDWQPLSHPAPFAGMWPNDGSVQTQQYVCKRCDFQGTAREQDRHDEDHYKDKP